MGSLWDEEEDALDALHDARVALLLGVLRSLVKMPSEEVQLAYGYPRRGHGHSYITAKE